MMFEKRKTPKRKEKQFNERGQEIPDDTRRSIPARRRIPTKFEEFRQMLRTASAIAANDGYESFEDSEDFNVDDEPDTVPDAPWETIFDPFVGREITRQEATFLDNERRSFERKYGRTKPWHARVLEKFNRKYPKKKEEPKKEEVSDDEE